MKCTKDLAVEMSMHVRTVKKWWKRLRVPPDIKGHACHRWSDRRAKLLISRWQAYWQLRGRSAQIVAAKHAGTFIDSKQLTFNFSEKNTPKKTFPKTSQSKINFQSARNH